MLKIWWSCAKRFRIYGEKTTGGYMNSPPPPVGRGLRVDCHLHLSPVTLLSHCTPWCSYIMMPYYLVALLSSKCSRSMNDTSYDVTSPISDWKIKLNLLSSYAIFLKKAQTCSVVHTDFFETTFRYILHFLEGGYLLLPCPWSLFFCVHGVEPPVG